MRYQVAPIQHSERRPIFHHRRDVISKVND